MRCSFISLSDSAHAVVWVRTLKRKNKNKKGTEGRDGVGRRRRRHKMKTTK
jgi:hypothetical protein